MKTILGFVLLTMSAIARGAEDSSSSQVRFREPMTPLVLAAGLLTWGVYELGDDSDEGWRNVGIYWGTAALVSVGLGTYQHLHEPSSTLHVGLVGKNPGLFVSCTF